MLIVSTDATFDILASPDPLLSVSLSPSQNLYTRRGTLVGASGNVDNVRITGSCGLMNYTMLMRSGDIYTVDARACYPCVSPYTFSLPKGGRD